MSGPVNALIGDDFGMEIPRTVVDEDELLDEKKMARFSKTKEFKKLKEHIESRIEFYQQYLPDGRPIAGVNVDSNNWVIANAIIGEFKAILAAYELANEAVRNVQ